MDVECGSGFAAAQCGEALPHRCAVLKELGEALPRPTSRHSLGLIRNCPAERQSLSALCDGKAAGKIDQFSIALTC